MNNEIFEMADRLKDARDRKSELKEQLKAAEAEISELDLALSDAMAESEVERFSRNGSTFYLNSRLFASPASGRKDELMPRRRASYSRSRMSRQKIRMLRITRNAEQSRKIRISVRSTACSLEACSGH